MDSQTIIELVNKIITNNKKTLHERGIYMFLRDGKEITEYDRTCIYTSWSLYMKEYKDRYDKIHECKRPEGVFRMDWNYIKSCYALLNKKGVISKRHSKAREILYNKLIYEKRVRMGRKKTRRREK